MYLPAEIIPMAAYFTESQTRVLKSAWICIIPLALHSLLTRYCRIDNNLIYNATYILAFMFLVCWEFLYTREWKKAGMVAGTSAGIFGLTVLIHYVFNIPSEGPALPYLPIHILTAANHFITLTVRCYLAGNRRFMAPAAIVLLVSQYGLAGALYGLLAVNLPVLRSLYFWEHGNTIFALAFFIIYPFAYYIALYLSENYFNRNGFSSVFHSKMQVLGSGEYLLLNIVLMTLIVNSATSAPQNLRLILEYSANLPEISYYPVLTPAILLTNIMEIIVHALMVLICGYLLRNAVVARMTTTGSRNGILYLLHYIPVLNVIPLIIYSSRKEEHASPAGNAMYYFQRDPSKLRSWIVFAGIVITSYSAYLLYDRLSYSHGVGTNAEEMLLVAVMLICIARVVAFFLMFNYRKAVFTLFFINFFLAFLAHSQRDLYELTGLRLALIYLSLYFLLEVFHPTLFNTDAEALEQSAGGTEEL
jgi:hypothetical protein